MRKSFCLLSAILLTLCFIDAGAQGKSKRIIIRDSTDSSLLEYKGELGYFQKAERDLGDPRFMFHDDRTNTDFGIGGTVNIAVFAGFDGSVLSSDFTPANIIVPTLDAKEFGTRVNSSEVHFKARTKWSKHTVISYIKLNGNTSNMLKFSQAYISFDGLSVGLIPTFFADLEVGARNVGMGIESTVDMSHPLIGYTTRLGNHWEIAGAFEKAALSVDYLDYQETGIGNLFQPMPDITLHFKYKWDGGHLQLGGLFRNLTYFSRVYLMSPNPIVQGTMYEYDEGVNCHNFGYGVSLSGSLKPSSSLKLSGQITAGKGIAEYVPEFGDENATLALLPFDGKANHRLMTPIPLGSCVLSAQYYWGKRCSSSIIVASAKCLKRLEDVDYATRFKWTFSAIGNFFWYFSDYAYIGTEFLYGLNTIYPDDIRPDEKSGHAARVAAVVAYLF